MYFAAARLGLRMAFVAEQVTLVWPPTGLAVAAVLLLGVRVWPGIWLGALLANLLANEPAGTAAGVATGNTLEAVVATWLLKRYGFNRALTGLRDVLLFVGLAALLSPTVSATIGVASLSLGGVQPWSAFGPLWLTWWLGDAMGALIVAPAILAWTAPPSLAWSRRRLGEAAALLAATLGASLLVFAGRMNVLAAHHHEAAYALFPFVIWAAVRFGQRGTVTAVLAIAGVAIWTTIHGIGPFVEASPHRGLVLLLIFMAVVSTTGLVIGAAVAERRTAERRRAADFAVTQILAESATLAEAAPRILEAICESLEWDVGAFWRIDRDGRLRCLEAWHKPTVKVPEFLAVTRERAFEPGVGLPGRVWSAGQPAWISDVVQDSNFPRAPIAAREGLHGAFGFPIRLGGEVLGIIEFFSHQIRQPDSDLLQMFETVGSQIGQFLDRRRAEEERVRLLANEQAARAEAEALVTRLQEAEAELRRAAQAKDQFLAVLGHELRNPLAPLRSALEVLRLRGTTDAVVARMTDMMERQIRHLVRLVDDLLDVSRITRGRIDLRPESVDLAAVVWRAVETSRALIDERGHRLTVKLPAEPIQLTADPTRLEQVLSNLLANAARYTEDGGRIGVTVERDGGQAVLRVSDTGIGIRPEMRERIFDVFVQADRTAQRAQEGLGVGLTLVRSLVEKHGGTVEASSEGPGRGSEFVVRLPLAAAPVFSRPPSSVGSAALAPARRVLVVDDNRDAAFSLVLLLQEQGHQAEMVHDGPAALTAAAQFAPDIVLLDIGLPGMDGYEVARRLRADRNGVAIVALTGYGQDEDRRRAAEAGFDLHLVKPVDPERLRQLLAGLKSGH